MFVIEKRKRKPQTETEEAPWNFAEELIKENRRVCQQKLVDKLVLHVSDSK